MCEFYHISDNFDELERHVTENGQKQYTWGISKRNIQVMLQEMVFVSRVAAEQNNNNNENGDSSPF